MISKVKDAETAGRGFAITGKDEYLEPYNDTVQVLSRLFQRLRENIRDEQARAMLAQIERLSAERVRHIDQLIATRRTEGSEAARRFVLAGQGKRIMDRLRHLMSAFQARQELLLSERSVLVKTQTHRTIAIIAAGAVLSVSLLLAIASKVG